MIDQQSCSGGERGNSHKRRADRCSRYDYALVEAARVALHRGNTIICTCVHCRCQGTTHIAHSATCCFHPSQLTQGKENTQCLNE